MAMKASDLGETLFRNLRFLMVHSKPNEDKNKQKVAVKLPPPLKAMRLKAKRMKALDRTESFLKIGRELAYYEDDFEYNGDPALFYPSYTSLADDELRGYFSWRTKFRKGQNTPTIKSFIMLYANEIINNIGVTDPLEGYNILKALYQKYKAEDGTLGYYLHKWLFGYVIYYNLDKKYLSDYEFKSKPILQMLDNLQKYDKKAIIDTLRDAPVKWLNRSKFYTTHKEDMDYVICNVLMRMYVYYSKGNRRPFISQLFGNPIRQHCYLFSGAIFSDPLKRIEFRYDIDPQTYFSFDQDYGSCMNYREVTEQGMRKLDQIIKTIDGMMREAYEYGHPLKIEINTKWLIKAISEEIAMLQHNKQAKAFAEQRANFKIDLSKLNEIRTDAALTQEKLTAPEEEGIASPGSVPTAAAHTAPIAPQAGLGTVEEDESDDTALLPTEVRLLHCLLYGGNLDWIQTEGHMLSVLVDSINEKLYERFADSVVDDSPALIPDYIEELKEMIPA